MGYNILTFSHSIIRYSGVVIGVGVLTHINLGMTHAVRSQPDRQDWPKNKTTDG